VTTGKVPNASCHVINAPFLPGTEPKAICGVEHPPPVVEDTDGDTDGEADTDPPKPKPHGHESLWKRLARQAEERRIAAEAAARAADTDPTNDGPIVVPPPGEPE
jgi:hypothetical protein